MVDELRFPRPSARGCHESTDLSQRQRCGEFFQQFIAQAMMSRRSQMRIGIENRQRIVASNLQQSDLAGDVRELQLWQTMLANAKKFTRTAQTQIHLGNLKTIG